MSKRKTKEKFIEDARKVHGDKYDYSLVDYVNNRRKVKIICPEHGVFEQTPEQHLRGCGCPKCAAYTTEKFIEKAKAVHGDKYDYSLAEYKGALEKIKIICPKHGVFEQKTSNHLQGRGCPKCAVEKSRTPGFTTEKFIEKAKAIHGDKYDYSLTEYKGAYENVKIICPEHGIFEQRASSHLNGNGCPKCSQKKQTKTAEDFIKEAKAVHGNKYDYSLVNYVSSKRKVKIICPEHGVFEQPPGQHLRGCGCPECGKMAQVLTTEEFIKKAKKMHGNKYDYSLTEYKGADEKVKIICPEHGVFEQRASTHLRGNGCLKCANKARTSTAKDFIEEAKTIHGDKYDYSLVNYKNSTTKVKIICPEHGAFEQTPKNHLKGYGCPECGKKARALTTEEFIEKAKAVHGNKYDYSLAEYKYANEKVKIVCPEHGVFEQIASSHLNGNGCPKCSRKKQTKTVEDFIKEAKAVHGNKYDYSLVEYKSARKKVKIICPKHGIFEQPPGYHLKGHGCPKCNSSKGETAIRTYLEEKEYNFHEQECIKYDIQRKGNNKKGFGKIDFCINEIGFIEFDGTQHFTIVNYYGGLNGYKKRIFKDFQKTSYCEEHGIPLLRIRYDQIGEIEEMVDDFIKAPEKYIKNHNTFLTNKEYYSIRESIN